MPNITFPNLADWYWIANNGSVYSSKRNQLVYPYDSLYQIFCSQNGGATNWPTDVSGNQTGASLQAALALNGINLTVPNP